MTRVVLLRREFADGRDDEPWRGGAIANWWLDYLMLMLDATAPSYCRRPVALHVRLSNGQLVTYRPRRPVPAHPETV